MSNLDKYKKPEEIEKRKRLFGKFMKPAPEAEAPKGKSKYIGRPIQVVDQIKGDAMITSPSEFIFAPAEHTLTRIEPFTGPPRINALADVKEMEKLMKNNPMTIHVCRPHTPVSGKVFKPTAPFWQDGQLLIPSADTAAMCEAFCRCGLQGKSHVMVAVNKFTVKLTTASRSGCKRFRPKQNQPDFGDE